MTPQEKYSKIMEVMSDKTLGKGLVYEYKLGTFEMLDSNNSIRIPNGVYHHNYQLFPNITPDIMFDKYEIIGHPLRLGDVLDWIEKNDGYHTRKYILLDMWKDKRIPLSPTDEQLVEYIYSLIA